MSGSSLVAAACCCRCGPNGRSSCRSVRPLAMLLAVRQDSSSGRASSSRAAIRAAAAAAAAAVVGQLSAHHVRAALGGIVCTHTADLQGAQGQAAVNVKRTQVMPP